MRLFARSILVAIAAVATSPVSAARIPNFFGPIEFVEWKLTRPCPP